MQEDTDFKLLDRLQHYYEESEAKTRKSRKLGMKTRAYYAGEQLPEEVIEELLSRPQPIVWENIIMKIGNKVAGIKDATKMEMKAYRTRVPDKAAANVYTNIIRAMHSVGEFSAHKSAADFDLMIAGISVIAKKVKPLEEFDMFGNRYYDLIDTHIPFEQVYQDPYAAQPDYSDARYITILKQYNRDDLESMFDKNLVARLDFSENPTTYSGVKLEIAPVAYTWYKDGKQIKWAIWGKDVLLANGDSPYEMKRFPFAIRYANKRDPNRPGEYYGMFKNILPLQDKINNAHLRIANMLGSTKMLFESSAVENADDFIDEYALDNAIVEVRDGAITKGKLKEIRIDSKLQGLMETIIDARRQAEEIVGLNAEILGNAVNRLSGYAIESRQNSGLIGLQQFMNASMLRDKDAAEMTIELAKQYIKAEQVYQIMDQKEADSYFIVNEIEKDASGNVKFQNGKPKRKNTITSGHYAVKLVQEPMSRGNIADRQKAWAEHLKSIAGYAPEAVMRLYPLMLRDTESTVADEVEQVLKEMQEEKAKNNQNAQLQQQQLELQMQKMQAQIADLIGKAKENEAQAQLHLAKAEDIRKGDDEFVKE